MKRILSSINHVLDIIDEILGYILDLPWPIHVIALGSFLVLWVPIDYLIDHNLYRNIPYATTFFKEHYIINNMLLVVHIAAAIPAIVFGPFLLSNKIRKDRPKVHRLLGKFYIFGCLVSAVTILPIASAHTIGLANVGFSAMATMWFILSFLAYNAARNKDFVAHRRWVIRSYAMTLAFVHVNLTYKLLLPFDMLSMESIKAFQSMISWQFNLFIAELYLAASSPADKLIGWDKFLKNLTRYNPADKFYLRVQH